MVCPYGPLCHPCGGKGGGKTEKPRFRKCGFFVVCPYGPLCHPCGGKGGGKKRKKHVLESVVFSRFVHTGLYVTHVEAREEVKTKKTRESVVFSWFVHTGLYVTHAGGKGGAFTLDSHWTVLHQADLYIRNPFTPEILLHQEPLSMQVRCTLKFNIGTCVL